MCVIAEGPIARQMGKLGEGERRRAVLTELVGRFGDKAASPLDQIGQCWTEQTTSALTSVNVRPPIRSRASNSATDSPACLSRNAAVSPTNPAPPRNDLRPP
jgi:hypothetical protein